MKTDKPNKSPKTQKVMTYQDAGVDRDKADKLVGKISALAKSTIVGAHRKRIKASVGGYASLYEWDSKTYMASATDGVGTKLKMAMWLEDHSTVGIDLVAMSVNDLICVGAEPLVFLDYFATGKLESGIAEQVIAGISEGCKQAGCALVGGETAEMPDFYTPGEYDLAGFAVGRAKKAKILPRPTSLIKPGMKLLGLASSGCHSNGYSLLRRLFFGAGSSAKLSDASASQIEIARKLLSPTRIYVKSLMPLIENGEVLGLAHITGSGFLNVPRISSAVSYEIVLPRVMDVAPIFGWVRTQSRLDLSELCQTFNMGIGMVIAVDPKKCTKVIKKLQKSGETVFELGQVTKKDKRGSGVFIDDPETRTQAWLSYEDG